MRNYRINCYKSFYLMIFFFSMIFIASTNPVNISFTRNTFPNLPSPSFEIILKFYLLRLVFGIDALFEGNWLFLLVWNNVFTKGDGRNPRFSADCVEAVSFNPLLRAFTSNNGFSLLLNLVLRLPDFYLEKVCLGLTGELDPKYYS